MVGESIKGANEGLSGFNDGLRGILDAFASIDLAIQETFRFLKGTFLGDWS